jgi:hypothetical protein
MGNNFRKVAIDFCTANNLASLNHYMKILAQRKVKMVQTIYSGSASANLDGCPAKILPNLTATGNSLSHG